MSSTILSSTLVLTLLLMIGLIFFIKASIKERTEQIEMISSDSLELLLEQLQSYFQNRSYTLTKVDPDQQKLVFQGYVRPSWFLAIFLSFLALVGLASLSLVFSLLYQESNFNFLLISLLSPLAGLFYWRGARRVEQVTVEVDSAQKLIVTGHRDELALVKAGFPSLIVNT